MEYAIIPIEKKRKSFFSQLVLEEKIAKIYNGIKISFVMLFSKPTVVSYSPPIYPSVYNLGIKLENTFKIKDEEPIIEKTNPVINKIKLIHLPNFTNLKINT